MIKNLLILFLSVALCSCGTNHKKLGQDYSQQGRYELAVDSYRRALSKKPDNPELKAQLIHAQRMLERWAVDLRVAADRHYQLGHTGKALILYGKLASLESEPSTLAKYKQLKTQLLSEHGYKVSFIDVDVTLDRLQLSSIPGLSDATEEAADALLEFFVSPMDLKILLSKEELSKEYVSKYVKIENPEYHETLELIDDQERLISEDQEKLERLEKDWDSLFKSRTILEKDKEIIDLKLEAAVSGSSEYKQLVSERSEISRQMQQVNKRYSSFSSKISSIKRHIKDARLVRNDLLQDLRTLPLTVDEPVYEDYHYLVTTKTQVAEAALKIVENNRVIRRDFEVRYSDTYHRSHPEIELEAKEAILKSKNQLQKNLNEVANKEAEAYLRSLIKAHKDQYLTLARQTADIERGFDYWVIHGLVGEPGVNSQVEASIRKSLEFEFGNTGIFDINGILDIR